MMRMMAIAVGGKEELKHRPRLFGICSAMSLLQMINLQLEGMYMLAEYGCPWPCPPEAMAGLLSKGHRLLSSPWSFVRRLFLGQSER
jgi:trimethylamine:corrinoid methyltransferase-like protein